MTRPYIAISLLGLAAACTAGGDEAGTDAATNATIEASMNDVWPPAGGIPETADGVRTDVWAGRWTGVEGTYLEISRGDAPGRYSLEMQYDLDNQGTFEGREEGAAIAFERNGETLRLTPSDGDATGLRNLFGKEDCLTVASGEGYCRD